MEDTIATTPQETVSADELLPEPAGQAPALSSADAQLKAVLEAIVYVTEEPLSAIQIADALGEPRERVEKMLELLVAEFDRPEHGVTIREVAGGRKLLTKARTRSWCSALVAIL